MKKQVIAAALLSIIFAPMAGSAIVVHGQGKKDPTVVYRHHTMHALKDAFAQISAIRKGNGDPADFAIHAKMVNANASGFYWAAKQKVPGGGSTDAVWSNWDDFAAKMDAFIVDTSAMAALPADADMKAMTMAFGKVARHCKKCHTDYRKD